MGQDAQQITVLQVAVAQEVLVAQAVSAATAAVEYVLYTS
jgi:hypothetical protein